MTETSRLLWTLGSTPIDPRVIGLGADGFPLPPPLSRDTTNDLEIPFHPTLVMSRVDTPLSKMKLGLQARNQFWPPPICVTKIGKKIIRNDPATTTGALQQGWVDSASERSRQAMVPYGILELPIAKGVDLTKQGDFSKNLCSVCFYHVPLRSWLLEPMHWKKKRTANATGVLTEKSIILKNLEDQLLVLSAEGFPREYAHITNVKRLVQWRTGGVSFDNGVLEAGVSETRREVVTPPASEPVSSDFTRNIAYGIPIRVLINLGLMSREAKECSKLLDYLTDQFNLPRAVLAVRKNTRQQTLQRKTYMDIFFPRITNQQWLSRIKEIPNKMATPKNMVVPIKDLLELSKDFPVEAQLTINRLINEAASKKEKINLDHDHDDVEIIPLTPHLRSIFLKHQIESEYNRIKVDRGWGQRLMPAFMLPFLLNHTSAHGRIVCGDGTSSGTGLACNFIYSGLVSLINSDHEVLDKNQRSAAWHDSRLLSLTISMAWTSSRQLYLRNAHNSAIYFTNLRTVHQSHKIVMQKLESTNALLRKVQKTNKRLLKIVAVKDTEKKKGSKRKRIGSKTASKPKKKTTLKKKKM